MHFQIALVATLLPALGMAGKYVNAGRNPGPNDCGASSFEGGPDNGIGQAPVDDCNGLVSQALANLNQEWSISTSWSRLFTSGNCAFSAAVVKGQNGLVAKIAGDDVADLAQDSIKNFANDGHVGCTGGYNQKVSADGVMPCNSPDGTQLYVKWVLSTSDFNPAN